MLIRNARIAGYPGLADLRLMHGEVREIGSGLTKGLYESELDVQGDELHPWRGEPLPRKIARIAHDISGMGEPIRPGTHEPLVRRNGEGRVVDFIHQHSAD